jgi:hypothetical protein
MAHAPRKLAPTASLWHLPGNRRGRWNSPMTAAGQAAKAAPDGYTVLFVFRSFE